MTRVLPSPQQRPFIFSLHHNNHVAPPQLLLSRVVHHQRLNHFLRPSTSSSSSTRSLTQNGQQADGDATPDQVVLPLSGCKGCGREEIEKGCNGEGRIQGGIATIPGFGWWPIKAYRPCPGFLASGGNYRRRGQSMDEVAFGGGKQGTSMGDLDDSGKRNKRTGQ